MSDYISRETLLSAVAGYDWEAGLKTVLKRIPAADVRPVVLCKDCYLHGSCYAEDVFELVHLADDNRFCGVAKRKANDTEMRRADHV